MPVSFRGWKGCYGTSNQVAALYRRLQSEGYSVILSHPKKTRYIVEAKIKSDRVDSRAIAELARVDALPLAYMPDKAAFFESRLGAEPFSLGNV